MLKKLIASISMVILLLAVMVAPAIAADTDTALVSGDIAYSGVIDVTAPSSIDFGTMEKGATATASSERPGSVVADAPSWHVLAIAQSTGSNYGHMVSGDNYLFSELQISAGEGEFQPASQGFDYAGSPHELPFSAQQAVSTDDVGGTYSITIVFTGSLAN